MDFIEKGATLFISKPFAFILSSKYRTVNCDHCFESGELLKCSGCQYVHYCNKTCQKRAWKTVHKSECANLKRIQPKIVPDAARLMARIIVKLSEGGENEKEYYEEKKCRTFDDLMTHSEEILKDDERMAHFHSLCGVLKTFLGNKYLPDDYKFRKLLDIYGRVCVNSFSICDEVMDNKGIGIYLAPSLLDHSCKPNAQAVFEGTTLIVRTIKDLPSLELSQIRILYISQLSTKEERRKELQTTYYFLCNCQRCAQPEPKNAAAACQNFSCVNPCNLDDEKCLLCGQEFSPDFRNTFEEVNKFLVDSESALANNDDWELVQKCLKKQEGILHPLNVHYIETLDSAFQAANNFGYWKEAESYSSRAILGYLEYYGKYHALTGILYLQLGKIQLYLEKLRDALKSLQESESILKVTHREKHTLFNNHLRPLFCQVQLEMLN